MTDDERKALLDHPSMRDAVQILAADNARLCERLIAAEKCIEAVRALGLHDSYPRVRSALDAYDAGKPS